MSSDPPARALVTLGGALPLALLLIITAPGCGRKEAPQPPPKKNPARTNDLTVMQRGDELILTLSYPSTTQGGLALPGIDRLEIFRYTRPAPEFMEQPVSEEGEPVEGEPEQEGAEEGAPKEGGEAATGDDEAAGSTEDPPPAPAPPLGEVETEDLLAAETGEGASRESASAEAPELQQTESPAESEEGPESGEREPAEEGEEAAGEVEINPFLQIRIDPDDFRKRSERLVDLEDTALQEAVTGGQIVVRIPLTEIATEPPVAYAFMARTHAGRLTSPDSNIASFVPLPTPPPPAGLGAVPARGGVELSWSTVETEIEIEGYNVYRRQPARGFPTQPLATLDSETTEHVDRSAAFGSRYVYAVTAFAMRRPLVEGALSAEAEVAYSDDFPPAAPTGLVVLAEAGRVRLVWTATSEADVVGYLVFVRRDAGEPEQLTPEPLGASEFIHEGTVAGTTYSYTVVAVDSAGNRSEASEEATTRAP